MIDMTILMIILVTFILRILPGALGWINTYAGDINFHLLCAERIRESGFKCPKKLKGFILPGIYDYPPLFHYILALIPRAHRERFSFLISPVIDTIHVMIIYYSVSYLLSLNRQLYIGNDPEIIAAIAALFFATSPALLYDGIGPRSYIATPRTLGELFITITFISQLFYLLNNNLGFLFLACFFSALTLLTSKFGGQVLIFFSVGLMVFLWRYEFILLPIIGILFATIISKGKYIEILNGWVKHSLLFKEVLIHKMPIFSARNNLKQFRNLANAVAYGDFKGFEKSALDLITNNTYIILVIRNVMLFPLIVLVADKLYIITSNSLIIFLIGWISISLLVFFITSLKPFLFLGEAERYIEYSIPAQIILFTILNMSPRAVFILLIYNIIFYLFNIFMIHFAYRGRKELKEATEKLINWFTIQNIKGKRILSIYVDNYFIAYRTDNLVLWPPGNFTKIDKELVNYLWEELEWPNRNLSLLINKYNIDLIIVNNKYLNYANRNGWDYNLSKYNVTYIDSFFTVYQL